MPQTWLICVEFQLVLLMAPVVYYLNKIYQDTYNINSNNNKFNKNDHNSVEKSKTKNNNNSSRLFFWLWTCPGAILVSCIVLGSASSFYNVFSNQLPPSWLYTMADPDSKAIYFEEHFMKIWTHLAVFATGIIGGLICRVAAKNVVISFRSRNLMSQTQNNLKSNNNQLSSSSSSLPAATQDGDGFIFSKSRITNGLNNSSISIDIQTNSSSHENISGSESGIVNNDNNSLSSSTTCRSLLLELTSLLVAFTIMASIIFSTYEWSTNDLPRPLLAGIFDAGSRLLWSLAFIWMLYMISVPDKNGKFSSISRALGHPIMVSLGKLSFLIYIIHPFVHTTVLAIQEQPIYSSWLMLIHILIGNITITVILASLMSLFVEMPCRNLFRRCGTSLLLTHTVDTTSTSAGSRQLTGLR